MEIKKVAVFEAELAGPKFNVCSCLYLNVIKTNGSTVWIIKGIQHTERATKPWHLYVTRIS